MDDILPDTGQWTKDKGLICIYILSFFLVQTAIQLTLESDSELPFPSKALRLFSAYLVNPKTEGALNDYIYGKQLFKMSSEEISEDSETKPVVLVSEEINAIRIKAISLMLSAPEETLRKVIRLFEEV